MILIFIEFSFHIRLYDLGCDNGEICTVNFINSTQRAHFKVEINLL